MGAETPATFTVFSRRNCHLCDEMILGLRDMQSCGDFEFKIVDVDRDPDLARRYGGDVPVLAFEGRELCRHFLDRAAVTAFLSEIR